MTASSGRASRDAGKATRKPLLRAATDFFA